MKPPDNFLYDPTFQPWDSQSWLSSHYSKGSERTLVSPDRCYLLLKALENSLQVSGDVFECGVYKGGTLKMIDSVMGKQRSKTLYAFDTFVGMPNTDPIKDDHNAGDFSDTSYESVSEFVGNEMVEIRKGFIPETFHGLESASICFAHVDVDIFKSVKDCCEFIWPRLTVGGSIIFDDYGFQQCYGARLAVDEFFDGMRCQPLVLHTGQAVIFKST